MEEPTHKECSKCHQIKPIERFRHRIGRSGRRRAECGDCHNAYLRMRKNHPELIKKRNKLGVEEKANITEKECSKCRQTKSVSLFPKRYGKRSGTYHAYCCECDNAYRCQFSVSSSLFSGKNSLY